MSKNVIDGLLYSEEHEWVKVEGKKAYIGITDYAQHALGEVVYVEMPEIDDEFSIGDAFGVIESVKAASDAFMPISGKIVEINAELDDSPYLINNQPYETWIIAVEITEEGELEGLMDAKKYQEFCAKEE